MARLTIETATDLLHQNMKNQNLRRHCYAVGKVLRAYRDYYVEEGRDVGKLTADDWEIVGLLHDSDYEITQDDWTKHTLVLLDWLKDYEVDEEILNVLRSHNNKITQLREPETLLEWTLECCDELTGFIVAVALVMPGKKLADVTVERVVKRFKQKEFARAVDRAQITQCEEKVNVPVEKFVEISLTAMQKNADLIGL
jgi:predicted hydrolase (HD superfamily)